MHTPTHRQSGAILASLCVFLLQIPLVFAQGNNQNNKPFLIEKESDLQLLQPLDDSTNTLTVNSNSEPLSGLYDYFNISWPLIVGSAAGIAVLYGLIGAIQIMLSGGGNGQQEGKARIQNAIISLLIIGLSGMILEILNPIFFRQA